MSKQVSNTNGQAGWLAGWRRSWIRKFWGKYIMLTHKNREKLPALAVNNMSETVKQPPDDLMIQTHHCVSSNWELQFSVLCCVLQNLLQKEARFHSTCPPVGGSGGLLTMHFDCQNEGSGWKGHSLAHKIVTNEREIWAHMVLNIIWRVGSSRKVFCCPLRFRFIHHYHYRYCYCYTLTICCSTFLLTNCTDQWSESPQSPS